MEIIDLSLVELEAALKEAPAGEGFVNVAAKGYTVEQLARIGARYWFEYHCWESHDSGDADVWYHSHQQCTVLSFADCNPPAFTGFVERGEAGASLLYRVRFDDGLEWDVFEDELMTSRDHFERPDPPLRRAK